MNEEAAAQDEEEEGGNDSYYDEEDDYYDEYEDEDDEYFIDLEQSERVDATYVFQKMAEFVDRGEQGDDRAQRAAADLGLYIMTHE